MNTGNDGICFCSLALGRGYSYLAQQLAADLAHFAPGTVFLIFTDHPTLFKRSANAHVIKHRKRSVLGYNDKLLVMNEALKRFSTAIFIDADTRILGPVNFGPEVREPGLKTFIIRRWSHFRATYDHSAEGPWWQKSDLRRMDLLAEKFALSDRGNDVPFIAEFLFSITKGQGVDLSSFFQEWNYLAEFSERNGFFIHLGFSMGLAAHLTGFPVEQYNFPGIRFFEPLVVSRTVHVADGTLTQEECDLLETTIRPYKAADRKSGFEGQKLKHWQTTFRHMWVKVFGLRLLE